MSTTMPTAHAATESGAAFLMPTKGSPVPAVVLTLFYVFGALAIVIGLFLLIWDAANHRGLSLRGLLVAFVGVVLVVLAAVLPPAAPDNDGYVGAGTMQDIDAAH